MFRFVKSFFLAAKPPNRAQDISCGAEFDCKSWLSQQISLPRLVIDAPSVGSPVGDKTLSVLSISRYPELEQFVHWPDP
jgi:hypothetical protein